MQPQAPAPAPAPAHGPQRIVTARPAARPTENFRPKRIFPLRQWDWLFIFTDMPMLVTLLWSLLTGLRRRPAPAQPCAPAAAEWAAIERALAELMELHAQWKAGTLPPQPRSDRRPARHRPAPPPGAHPGSVPRPAPHRPLAPVPHPAAAPAARRPPPAAHRAAHRAAAGHHRPPPHRLGRILHPATPLPSGSGANPARVDFVAI